MPSYKKTPTPPHNDNNPQIIQYNNNKIIIFFIHQATDQGLDMSQCTCRLYLCRMAV